MSKYFFNWFLNCYQIKIRVQMWDKTFLIFFSKFENFPDNRDIHKVRKRQHQYPEFGDTQGETRKKPAKNYISIQGRGETHKTILSFTLSSLFPERLHCCYIDFSATIISLEPEFQHFILRFSKISLLYRYHFQKGLGGVKGGPKTGWR